MSDKQSLFERWRWAITAGAALEGWSAVRHTARHEVSGYFWPDALTLPILWLSALGITILAIAGWYAAFYRRRVANAEPPAA